MAKAAGRSAMTLKLASKTMGTRLPQCCQTIDQSLEVALDDLSATAVRVTMPRRFCEQDTRWQGTQAARVDELVGASDPAQQDSRHCCIERLPVRLPPLRR
jgi:hypothetical protein